MKRLLFLLFLLFSSSVFAGSGEGLGGEGEENGYQQKDFNLLKDLEVMNRAVINELRKQDFQVKYGGLTKEYNHTEKRVVIREKSNMLLDIQLLTPYTVKNLIASNDTKVAEFYLNDFSQKQKLFSSFEFYDIRRDYNQVEQDVWFKYAVDSVECEKQGEKKVCWNNTDWIQFENLSELPSKRVRIGLFTNVQPREQIEWVGINNGFRFIEWGAWEVSNLQFIDTHSGNNLSDGFFVWDDTGDRLWFNGEGYMSKDIEEFKCTDSWNLSSCTRNITKTISEGGNYLYRFYWNSDGTTFWLLSSDYYIREYSCDAFNITSCSYSGTNMSISTGTFDFHWSDDGGKLMGITSDGDKVEEYSCGTGYDISSCNLSDSKSLSDYTPRTMDWNETGNKFFYSGSEHEDIFEFDCSTGFDVSECLKVATFDASEWLYTPTGLIIKPDGLTFWISSVIDGYITEFEVMLVFYSSVSDNSSGGVSPGTIVGADAYWEADQTNLDTITFYHNASGSMTEVSTCSPSSTNESWCNKTINTIGHDGETICWKQTANDTDGNVNTFMGDSEHCFWVSASYSLVSPQGMSLTIMGLRRAKMYRTNTRSIGVTSGIESVPTRIKTIGGNFSISESISSVGGFSRVLGLSSSVGFGLDGVSGVFRVVSDSFGVGSVLSGLSSFVRFVSSSFGFGDGLLGVSFVYDESVHDPTGSALVNVSGNWTGLTDGNSDVVGNYSMSSSWVDLVNVTVNGSVWYNSTYNSSFVWIEGDDVVIKFNGTLDDGVGIPVGLWYSDDPISIVSGAVSGGDNAVWNDNTSFWKGVTVTNPASGTYYNVTLDTSVPVDSVNGSVVVYDPVNNPVASSSNVTAGTVSWNDSSVPPGSEVWNVSYDVFMNVSNSNFTDSVGGRDYWFNEFNTTSGVTAVDDVLYYSVIPNASDVIGLALLLNDSAVTTNSDYSFSTFDLDGDGYTDYVNWTADIDASNRQEWVVQADMGFPINVTGVKVITNKPVREGKLIDWRWGLQFFNNNTFGVDYTYKARLPVGARDIELSGVQMDLSFDVYGAYVPIEVYVPAQETVTRYVTYTTDPVTAYMKVFYPDSFWVDELNEIMINVTLLNNAPDQITNITKEIPIAHGENVKLFNGSVELDKVDVVEGQYTMEISSLEGNGERTFSVVYEKMVAVSELVSRNVNQKGFPVVLYNVKSITDQKLEEVRFKVENLSCLEVVNVTDFDSGEELDYECNENSSYNIILAVLIDDLAVNEERSVLVNFYSEDAQFVVESDRVLHVFVVWGSRGLVILLLLCVSYIILDYYEQRTGRLSELWEGLNG